MLFVPTGKFQACNGLVEEKECNSRTLGFKLKPAWITASHPRCGSVNRSFRYIYIWVFQWPGHAWNAVSGEQLERLCSLDINSISRACNSSHFLMFWRLCTSSSEYCWTQTNKSGSSCKRIGQLGLALASPEGDLQLLACPSECRHYAEIALALNHRQTYWQMKYIVT